MTVLVTGAAGFIGAGVCERLLARGEQVVGVDNLNPYYDPALKQARLQRLEAQAAASGCPSAWRFQQLDLAQRELGWQPTVALEQGLEPTIAWFRELLHDGTSLA